MHAQLGYSGIHCPTTQSGTCHGTNCASAATVVSGLEDLQCTTTFLCDPLKEGDADTVGGYVAIRIILDLRQPLACLLQWGASYRYRNSHVEPWAMILKVDAKKVGVDGMSNI